MNDGDAMNTEDSREQYTPGDGEPIPMSEFTLGERYGSEDMYRDMGIERPGNVVAVESVAVQPVDPRPQVDWAELPGVLGEE